MTSHPGIQPIKVTVRVVQGNTYKDFSALIFKPPPGESSPPLYELMGDDLTLSLSLRTRALQPPDEIPGVW